MKTIKSIAIETSCRVGGVVFGEGDAIISAEPLGPSGRHAAELLAKLDEMLSARNIKPADLDELYISAGPGSFTGLRVGITVARTLGQVYPSLKIVAVPTADAVAQNVVGEVGESEFGWENLGVFLAAKRATAGHAECSVHATLYRRDDKGHPEQVGESAVVDPGEIISAWPRPLLLSGEGLEYAGVTPGNNIQLVPENFRLPTVENVWQIGRGLATAGNFTPFSQLLPVYARRPEAVRLWEKKQAAEQ